MGIDARLTELGIVIPESTPPVANYVTARQSGSLLFLSGHLGKRDGVEGDVHLELIVGVAGGVESAHVVRGVGRGLDEAALGAVRQFRFAPATKDGHAVRVRMGWSMQFRLQ